MKRGPCQAHFEIVREQCVATHLFSTYPSRLLEVATPGCSAKARGCVTLYWIQYGGGMVSGDEYWLELELMHDATVVLATQGANKVYKVAVAHSIHEFATRAVLECSLAAKSTLVCAPEPTILYRGATFTQDVVIHMHHTASLFHVEWVSSGRKNGRNESWNFKRFYSTIKIIVSSASGDSASSTAVVNERVVLSDDDQFGSLQTRMGRFESQATIYIFGPALEKAAEAIKQFAWQAHNQLLPNTLVSVSESVRYASLRLPSSANVIIRIAAVSTELAHKAVEACAAPLVGLVDHHPYERRGN